MDASELDGLRELLATAEPARLGPEKRTGTLAPDALQTRLETWLKKTRVPDERRRLIRALVLLWHDHPDAAHALAQDDETADGSFVHAIVHRREPDSWNSKYWFRRVGNHPAYAEIARRVAAWLATRGETSLAKKLLPDGKWDAMAFVDACEQPAGNEEFLREIQRMEFEVLLEHLGDDNNGG